MNKPAHSHVLESEAERGTHVPHRHMNTGEQPEYTEAVEHFLDYWANNDDGKTHCERMVQKLTANGLSVGIGRYPDAIRYLKPQHFECKRHEESKKDEPPQFPTTRAEPRD